MNFYEAFAQLVDEHLSTHPEDSICQLAERACVHHATIYRIKKGEDRPSRLTLLQILRWGLQLDEERCQQMERLLFEEPPRHHARSA